MLKQQGFSLIEVMVAFLIAGVGIMGAIGLQNLALQNNQASQNQVYGAYLAYDMIDRIRANRSALADYAGNGAAVAACAAEAEAICAPTNRASTDKAEWDSALQAALGANVQATVCIDSTPNDGASSGAAACDGAGDSWVVKIWWYEGQDAADDGDGIAQALNIDNTPDTPSFFLAFRP